MKKLVLVTLIASLLIAVFWLRGPEGEDAPPPASAPGPSAPVEVLPSSASPTAAMPPPQPSSTAPPVGPIVAPPPPPVNIPPGYLESIRNSPEMQELEEVALQLRNFGLRFGGNPTGSNAEIVKALNGANEKRAIYLPSNAKLNEKGELLDPWGKPYFFHSNSATETEVRSAGPDGQLHTPDDLITK
jgi:hypothetical protein